MPGGKAASTKIAPGERGNSQIPKNLPIGRSTCCNSNKANPWHVNSSSIWQLWNQQLIALGVSLSRFFLNLCQLLNRTNCRDRLSEASSGLHLTKISKIFMLDRRMKTKRKGPASPNCQCNASAWLSVVLVKYPLGNTACLSWETRKLYGLRNAS